MTIGGKIKKARLENGLTQEEMAKKLMVSRQAITKWEADKGIPDVPNLKLLSKLLGVSVDYLIDDGEAVDMSVIGDNIDLPPYGKAVIKKSLTDKLIRDKFPDAEIHTLLPEKKKDKVDNCLDFIVEFFTPLCGLNDIKNSLKLLGTEYYLVTEEKRQFLVAVNYKEGFMESRRVAEPRNSRKGDKFTIGDIIFTDCGELKR